eukprot:1106062-Rhodomonas_salina.1
MGIGASCSHSIRKVNCSTCRVVTVVADAPGSSRSTRSVVVAWCRHGVASDHDRVKGPMGQWLCPVC